MSSQYCQPSDLTTTGVNPTALQTISVAQQVTACIQASELADSYMRGRYQLPLLAYGPDLTYRTAIIAVYMLLQARGMNPAAGADDRIRLNYEDSIRWFEGIQRQAVHPDVTPSVAQPGDSTYDLPQVQSAPQRGWLTYSSQGKPTVGW